MRAVGSAPANALLFDLSAPPRAHGMLGAVQTDALEHLTRVFGLSALRPEQAEAVQASLAGRDALVVLPTGYGKSLCYQLPAVTLARRGLGLTLVVSPLIALMDDQVAALVARGVRAGTLHSGVPWATQRKLLDELSTYELLYVSPERLESAALRRRLQGVARVAIDEAHCISEWGHDFRPEYARLGWLKRELGLPVMAATATATARVRDDITRSLALSEPLRIEGSTLRPNLSFRVALPSTHATRTAWAAELLAARGFDKKRVEGRALVFAATRARAETVQRALRKAGIRAGYYHAGRRNSARLNAQARFQAGTTPVLVATSAFGMGIDMPDVRLVLHVEAPATLESYVQQAGRAGRDGLPAECWLAFSHADLRIHERLRAHDRARASEDFQLLADYALGATCRQHAIALHLESPDSTACGSCDVCTEPDGVRARAQSAQRTREATADAKRKKLAAEVETALLGARERELIVAFVDALPKPLGRRYVAHALRGSRARALIKKGAHKNPHFGALRGVAEGAIYAALDALLSEGLLVPRGKKYPTLWIAGKQVRARASEPKRERATPTPLEAALRRFRRSEARRRRIKPYQVFQNRTLKALCEARPDSLDGLRAVWGIGDERAEKYGSALLELTRSAV